ncbi:carboxypeptidase-like regulatory domain-containing protein, partial [Lutimonas sp.]|uniref:carboxypeptidase-like regulatory domain-containing protein n=1 Tax=Lutimonas sp. TaxID=1872403 RepID=UPI003C74077A
MLNIIRNSLFILAIFTGFCHAQKGSQERFQVLDQESEQPVIYATVILQQAKIAVISDDNGNFRIPGIYKILQDTLKISSIGYRTLFVPLELQKENDINII